LTVVSSEDGGSDGGPPTIADTPRTRASADAIAQLPGRFTVVQTLGEGGMGTVVEAYDRVLSRAVAIKALSRSSRDDPNTGVRFLREARAAARLRHPNIVQVHDVDPEGGFIVMELVRGESLSTRLWRENKLSTDEVRRVGSALLGALGTAHQAGIVHRDVKPANILLGEHGEVKLADFGVAHFGDSEVTMPGTRVGTPAYMAPEQLRGKEADARADVYAAGVTLFEAATGTRPDDERDGYDPHAVLVAATGDVVLSDAIRRAIQPRPSDRFGDAGAFLAALDATAVPTAPPRARTLRRSWRGRVALLGVGSVVVASAIVAGTWLARDVPDRDPTAAPASPIAGGSAGRAGAGSATSHRVAIALLPFIDRTHDPRLDFAAAGLPNLLGMELHGIADLRVVGYYQLLGMAGSDAPPDGWVAAARALHADVVVRGEITGAGSGVHLRIAIDGLGSAEARSLDTIDRDDAVEDLPETVRQVAPEIARAAVGRAVAIDTGSAGVSFDAERELQLGIADVEREHLPDAIAHLEVALHHTPGLAIARYYLAIARSWSVPPAQPALDEIERALATGRLDDAQQSVLAGLRHIATLDYAGCIAAMEPRAAAHPDERDVLYVLFECQFHGGHPERAMPVYHHIHELAPKFRLALIHVLTYSIAHMDEAGMRWALELDDPAGEAYSPIWEPQIMLAHRDYDGAIRLLSQRLERANEVKRDVQGQLVVAYALSNQLDLAGTLAHELEEVNANQTATMLLGIASARGDQPARRRWLDAVERVMALQPADVSQALALALLAGAQAPIASRDELVALDAAMTTRLPPTYERALNHQLGVVLVAAGLGDAKRLGVLAASPYPEVAELAKAAQARSHGDRAAAAAAMRASIAATGDGRFLVDQWWLLAGDLHALGDHKATIAACDEVIRPRLFLTWAWGATVGDCLAWTGEAAEALDQPDDARRAWRRLVATRSAAAADDPLLRAARAALVRLDGK
jgi:tetratricopeptide (TPR) repeat protein